MIIRIIWSLIFLSFTCQVLALQEKEDEPVVTFLTKLGSHDVPAFVITAIDHKTKNAALKQLSSGSDSAASSHYEDLFKSADTKQDDEGITTFRSAYKILSQQYHDSNDSSMSYPRENVTEHSSSKIGASNAESDVLQPNPTFSIIHSYQPDPRRPLLIPEYRHRKSNRRRPNHYVPSDVYTIESAAQYPPRELHSNAIFYQKALSFLRDYKKVLVNKRPYGLTYRPNSHTDDPSHIRAAYKENRPVVVKNYDTPLTPVQSPYPTPEPRTRSYESSVQPYNQLEPYQQQSPLQNLPMTDIVPIRNDRQELVGYMPVIQVPRAADPIYNTEQSQYNKQPQVPSYLPLWSPQASSIADVKGLPQRDRELPPGTKGGSSRGRKKKRGGKRRSRYLSPSLRSRSRRKQRRRQHHDAPAPSSSRYDHYAEPYQSASSYPTSGNMNGQDRMYPHTSASDLTRSQYPPARRDSLVPILKLSFNPPAH